MNFDVNVILSLLVSFQLFFIAFFLLTNNAGKRISNVLLGLFFLLLAINVVDILLQINGIRSFFPLFFLLNDSFLLLFGPLIHLYVLSNIFKDFTLKRNYWFHFVPFLLCFIGLLFLYSSVDTSYEDSLETVSNANFPIGVLTILGLFYLHGGIYLGLSKRGLNAYDEFIKEQYSNISRVNLDWLHFIINSFIGIWLLGIVLSIIPFTIYKPYIYIVLFLFIIFLFYFINRIILKALKKPELFSGIPYASKERYAGSMLSEAKRNTFAKELLIRMEKERLYLNPDLTINDIAQLLDLSSKEVSQIINQSFNKHFFDFVNSYRIEEAKNLLRDTTNSMTIQEIMYTVGFSSKSSFNTIFKKKTKKTPTAFRLAQTKQ